MLIGVFVLVALYAWSIRRRRPAAARYSRLLLIRDALLEGRAEGVNVVNLLASQWGEMFSNVGDFDGKKELKQSPLHAFLATRDGVDINEAMLKLGNPELRRCVINFVRKLGNVYGVHA